MHFPLDTPIDPDGPIKRDNALEAGALAEEGKLIVFRDGCFLVSPHIGILLRTPHAIQPGRGLNETFLCPPLAYKATASVLHEFGVESQLIR
jgi:hypothetical protein